MSTFIIYMFTLGLATSLHCVSMCGPLVLTYAVKGEEGGPWYRKLNPNLAYQGAKVVSYMTVGLLLGAVGSFLNLDALRPYVMFLAGAFMIVLGLGMTGKVPWAAKFTPRPPKFLMTAIMKLRRKSVADAATGDSSYATPVFFGLLTGLLPCGPLMAAQVSAAASGSPISGALGMAAFGLGTAPLMLAFGTAGSLIPPVWKQRLMTVLAVGVMLFGLVFINRGLLLVGSPVNFTSVKTAVLGGPSATDAQYSQGSDGVVEVPLAIVGGQYQPQAVQIPADKPVRLVVNRQEDNSCSDQLALPQLGILVDLKPNGVTTVDIPATKAGSYTLTCGMGMMSGQLQVGGAAASGLPPVAWLLFAVGTAGLALYLGTRKSQPEKQPAKGAPSAPRNGKKASGSVPSPAARTASTHARAGDVSAARVVVNSKLVLWLAGVAALLAGVLFSRIVAL